MRWDCLCIIRTSFGLRNVACRLLSFEGLNSFWACCIFCLECDGIDCVWIGCCLGSEMSPVCWSLCHEWGYIRRWGAWVFSHPSHLLDFGFLSLECFLWLLSRILEVLEGDMSSYVAPTIADPAILHAEPEHHISTSNRLEVNFSLVLVLSVFCILPPVARNAC